jgi:hypothetical protein
MSRRNGEWLPAEPPMTMMSFFATWQLLPSGEAPGEARRSNSN